MHGRITFLNFGLQVLGCLMILSASVDSCANITTSYEDEEADGEESVWAVGVSSLNVTFRFSKDPRYSIYSITEYSPNSTEVRSCRFSYMDDCVPEAGCGNCKLIESDCLSITYHMDNITALKNLSVIRLSPITGADVDPILETVVNIKECNPQSHTIVEPEPSCVYNQFNCPSLFSCDTDAGFQREEMYAVCQANATWNNTLVCTVSVCCLYWLVSLIAFLIDVPIILLLVISCKESCSCACCPSESDLRIILIGSIAAAGVSFTGTLVGAFVCETAGRIVTLVFGCTSLAWELPTGIYYLVVYVCEKKTK